MLILSVAYLFLRDRHSFWRKRGFPYKPNPSLLFGQMQGNGTTRHAAYVTQEIYNYAQDRGERFVGYNFFFMPLVMVCDIELVKTVLVKDFGVFHDRGIYSNAQIDPLSANLFALEGNPWRLLRQKLTPTFTSGRMKQMFGTIWDVALELEKYMEANYNQPEIEMKDVLSRFTTDVIGTCAFGIECNTLRTADSEFRKYGNKAFELNPIIMFKLFLSSSYPGLVRKLRMKITYDDVEDFFMKIVRDTVNYRETNNVKRNDFMNLLLQIKNKGKLDDSDDGSVGKGEVGMTQTELAAQAFVFFLAGFETSSTTQSFCLYELAKNPDIQERLRQEINQAINENGGQVTYDVAMSIQYLDNVINETLRKYPPVESLNRVPSVDYVIPGTKHVIPKRTLVQIPVHAIQRDPDHYPDPERFDPDRFTPEEVKKRHPFTFLPFGEGPRICIGLRFGVMQTKVGLITLLRKFRFSPSARTPDRVSFDPKMITLSPNEGNYLKVERL
ncbi:probable cytochrome P450 6a14 isoform X2 [Anopheles maculipalpis]|uniref:probable cytochrome P450 6a14 isoform X2 n=1 Tax=Anopheles maculipalpis TaxID=1496333 RepID=UPI0021597E0F|nr:probable cytochrome P450 6a14 isoform X2 [Anopheles maculipalpis]